MQPYMALNYMMKVQAADDVAELRRARFETQQSQINVLSGLIDSVSNCTLSLQVHHFECGYGFFTTSKCANVDYLRVSPKSK